jgi:hypothetical protein
MRFEIPCFTGRRRFVNLEKNTSLEAEVPYSDFTRILIFIYHLIFLVETRQNLFTTHAARIRFKSYDVRKFSKQTGDPYRFSLKIWYSNIFYLFY